MASKTVQRVLSRVESFIVQRQLLAPGGSCIVALSGGADSVALLHVMFRLGYRVEAATCNFHLRAAEADRDEAFCIELCGRLGVKLHRAHFDTRAYASLHKVSIEMAARELRYRYFEQLRTDLGFEAIAVAHHRDDCAETVLLNLVRGTGIRGLAGIRPKNGNVVRPLLCLSRSEIEDFLAALGQEFVTDSTNLVADVGRNIVRLEVLPLLEKLNPAARKNIFEASQHVFEEATLVEQALNEASRRVFTQGAETEGWLEGIIDITQLLSYAVPETLLHHLLAPYGFSSAQSSGLFSQLKKAQSGRLWTSSTHEVLLDRWRLLIKKKDTHTYSEMRIPEPGIYIYAKDRRFSITLEDVTEHFQVSRLSHCATLDADCAKFPLTIRPFRKGDRFVPFGMKGKQRLVSDYLTDCKRTLFEKRSQLVVCDADSRILWLVGERTDERCRITQNTRKVLRIEVGKK